MKVCWGVGEERKVRRLGRVWIESEVMLDRLGWRQGVRVMIKDYKL